MKPRLVRGFFLTAQGVMSASAGGVPCAPDPCGRQRRGSARPQFVFPAAPFTARLRRIPPGPGRPHRPDRRCIADQSFGGRQADRKLGNNENAVLQTELKVDLNAYLAGSPPAVRSRTLAQLIAFDDAHPQEMTWFGQSTFIKVERTRGLKNPAYREARAANLRLAGPEGIDRLLREHDVVALVSPTQNPASVIDLVNGDGGIGPGDSCLPAVAGYPYITLPMGAVHGLPVGLSFIGPKWSEGRLLGLAYDYEQASHVSLRPTFAPDVLHRRPAPSCR